MFVPPSSFSASSTPECSNSSYGLPSCFGIETVFMPFLSGAFGSTLPLSDEDDDELLDELSSFLVSPQAASISVVASTASAAMSARGIAIDPPQGVGMTGGAASP